MKTTDKNFEDMVANITKKVVDYLLKINKEQIVIEALCHETLPELETPIINTDFEKFIIMGKDFPELSTQEKLIAIKSAIHTHFRLTEGIVIGIGEIIAYELQFTKRNREYKILFETDGTLTEEKMKQYF